MGHHGYNVQFLLFKFAVYWWWTTHEVWFMVLLWSSNFSLIGLSVSEILQYFSLILPIHTNFGGIFSTNYNLIVLTPKRTVLAPKHVIWPIKREHLCRGLTSMQDQEKGQEKVTKLLYFTCFGRSSQWNDLNQNMHRWWCPQLSHFCQVSKWNFWGLWFYRV